MYICEECGHLFEDGEEKTYTESYGEQRSVCPSCGGGYDIAKPCVICGAYDADSSESGYCEECQVRVKKEVSDFMDGFTCEERDLVNDLYDGERL